MADLFEILLSGRLDNDATSRSIEKDLSKIALKPIEIKASLDNSSLSKIGKQIENMHRQSGNKTNIADQIFDVSKLDKQNRIYFSKVYNSIDKMMPSIKAKFKNLGFDESTLKVTGLENAKGSIKSFGVSVKDAANQIRTFNFEKQKIDIGGKQRFGLVQSDSVKILNNTNKELQSSLNFISRIQSRIDNINSKTFNLSKPLISDKNSSLYNSKLEETVSKINAVRSSNSILSDEHKRDIGSMIADLDRYRKELQNVEYSATKLNPDTFVNAQKQLQATLQTNVKKWDSSGLVDDNFKAKILDAKNALDSATKTEHLDEYRTKLKLLTEDYKQLGIQSKNIQKLTALNYKKENFQQKIDTYLARNTALQMNTKKARELKSELLSLRQASKSVGVEDFGNLNKQLSTTKNKVKAAGLETRKFSDELKNNFLKFSQWVGASAIFFGLQRAIKGTVSDVVKLDTAMTSLKKVTDETDAKYNSFLTSASSNAKELGQSVSSLVEQTAQWAKLGYNIDQASELAKVSSIYSNVGEVDNKTAVSDIVTALKAFNIEASQSITIVDSLNKLGNEFATDAGSLGEGLKNAASALALGGMDINKALALLTGGSEITQDAGELGNALKVGQMRVMGMKGALEELGEESEGLESVSKIQTHILNLTKGQVNIMNEADPTKFKDYYDILESVAKVYGSLKETEQADILDTLFGKQRGNQGAAVLQAFMSGQVQKALEASKNSMGSAMEEQDKWIQSIEGKLGRLSATSETFSKTFMSTDLVKNAVDGSNTVLEVVTLIVDKLGTVPLILTSISAFMGSKNVALTDLGSLFSPTAKIDKMDTTYLNNLFEAFNNGKSVQELEIQFGKLNKTTRTYLATAEQGSATMEGLTSHVNSAKMAFAATAKSIATNVGIMLAVTLAIKGIAWAFDKANVTFEEQKEKVDGLTESYNKLKSEADALNAKNPDDLTDGEKQRLEYLTRKLALEEKILATENKKLAESEITGKGNIFSDGIIGEAKSLGSQVADTEYLANKELEHLTEIREKLDNLNEWSPTYQKDIDTLTNSEDKSIKALDEHKKKLDELEVKYLDYANKIQGYLDSGAFDDDTEQKEKMQALVDEYNTMADNIEQHKIKIALEMGDTDFVYQSDTFKKVEEELQELAKQGKLTSDTLADNKYKELVALMDLFGISIEDVVKKMNGISSESESALSPLTQAVEDYKSSIDGLPDKLIGLEEIQSQVNDGYSYSYDEIEKLKQKYPELENAIYRTADGWSIEKGAVDELYTATGDLGNQYANVQAQMTAALNSDMANRLRNLGIELEGIKSIADAYAAIANVGKNALNNLGIGLKSTGTLLDKINSPMADSFNKAIGSALVGEKESNFLVGLGSAVEEVEKQQAKLKNLTSGRVSGGKASGGGSGSKGSKGSKEKEEDLNKKAFEESYKTLKHNLDMQEITERDYYTSLDKLYKKHFSDKTKYLDEYRQYEEEVYGGMKKVREEEYNDIVKNLEQALKLFARDEGTEDAQTNTLKILQEATKKQIKSLMDSGTPVNSDDIRGLQDKLFGYEDNEKSIYKSQLDGMLDDYRDFIDSKNTYKGIDYKSQLDAYKKMRQTVEDYYKANKISAKDYADYIKDIDKNVLDITKTMYEQYRDKMVSEIEDKIESLQDEIKEVEDSYNTRIDRLKETLEETNKSYDERIDKLKEEKDLLSKQQDEQSKLLDIERARQNLAKTKDQKSLNLFRMGSGEDWEVNQDDVREAQNALDDLIAEEEKRKETLKFDDEIKELEDLKKANEDSVNSQIKNLEKLRDNAKKSLEDQIKKYEEYKNKAEKSLDLSKSFDDLQGRILELKDFEKMSFDERLENLEDFTKEYEKKMDRISRAKEKGDNSDSGNSKSKSSSSGGSIVSKTVNAIKSTVGKIFHHDGGIIGDGSNRHKDLFELANYELKSDEEPAILQKGEGVFTEKQMDNIIDRININHPIQLSDPSLFENLITLNRDIPKFNINIPDFSNIGNKGNEVQQDVHIDKLVFPQVKDANGIEDKIRGLSGEAYQWTNKRK